MCNYNKDWNRIGSKSLEQLLTEHADISCKIPSDIHIDSPRILLRLYALYLTDMIFHYPNY